MPVVPGQGWREAADLGGGEGFRDGGEGGGGKRDDDRGGGSRDGGLVC